MIGPELRTHISNHLALLHLETHAPKTAEGNTSSPLLLGDPKMRASTPPKTTRLTWIRAIREWLRCLGDAPAKRA